MDNRGFSRDIPFDELPMMMSVSMLAQVTGQHVGSIRRGINEGRIPADKVNGRWVICRDVVFENASKELHHGADERGA